MVESWDFNYTGDTFERTSSLVGSQIARRNRSGKAARLANQYRHRHADPPETVRPSTSCNGTLKVMHWQARENFRRNFCKTIELAFKEHGSDLLIVTAAGNSSKQSLTEDEASLIESLNVVYNHVPSSDRFGHFVTIHKRDLELTHDIATSKHSIDVTGQANESAIGHITKLTLIDKVSTRKLLIMACYSRPTGSASKLQRSLLNFGGEMLKLAKSERIEHGIDSTVDIIAVGDFNAVVDPNWDLTRETNSSRSDDGSAMKSLLSPLHVRSAHHVLSPRTKEWSYESKAQSSRGSRSRKLSDHALISRSITPKRMRYLHFDEVFEFTGDRHIDHKPFTLEVELPQHKFQHITDDNGNRPPTAVFYRLKSADDDAWRRAAARAEAEIEAIRYANPSSVEDVNRLGLLINHVLLNAVEREVGFRRTGAKPRRYRDPVVALARQGVRACEAKRRTLFEHRSHGTPSSNFLLTTLVELKDLGTHFLPDTEVRANYASKMNSLIDDAPSMSEVLRICHYARNKFRDVIKRRERQIDEQLSRLRLREVAAELVRDGEFGHRKFGLIKRGSRRFNPPITSVRVGDTIYVRPDDIKEHCPSYLEGFQNKAKPPTEVPHRFFRHVKKLSNATASALDISISRPELDSAISRVRSGKAAGRSMVPPKILKFLGPSFRATLLRLFNCCFRLGVQAEDWTEGLIHAIYKQKGDPADMVNRRPVALLDVVAKLYESILTARLVSALESDHIRSLLQKGFRPDHDPNEAARMVTSLLKDAKLKDHPMYCVFLDLEKAFDTIPLWLTEMALEQHGFPRQFTKAMLSLYGNYGVSYITAYGLSRRILTSKRGQKQGALASPALFTLVMNPFLAWLEQSKHGIKVNGTSIGGAAIADDLALFSDSADSLTKMWNKFRSFADFADLSINGSKTKGIASNEGRSRGLPTLPLRDSHIEWLEPNVSYRYLGFMVNSNLDWSEHETCLVDSIRRKTGTIMRHDLLCTGDKLAILRTVTEGILNYNVRTFLPSLACMRLCDAAIASTLRSALGAQRHSVSVTLNLLGLRSFQVLAPMLHAKAVANSTFAREDPFSTEVECQLISTPAARWTDPQFAEAKSAYKRLKRAKLAADSASMLITQIDQLRAVHLGIPPLDKLLPLYGLTLVRGRNGVDEEPIRNLSSDRKPTDRSWPLLSDNPISKFDLGTAIQEVNYQLRLDELPDHASTWLCGATDGSAKAKASRQRWKVNGEMSSGLVLTRQLPRLKRERWEAYRFLPPEMLDNGEEQHLDTSQIWKHAFPANGRPLSYIAETAALTAIVKLATMLRVNLFLFTDALSLLQQMVRMTSLGLRPGKKAYVKFGSHIEQLYMSVAHMKRAGLHICCEFVFSHTRDDEQSLAEYYNEIAKAAELELKCARVLQRYHDPRQELSRASRLERRAETQLAQHEAITARTLSLLEEGRADPTHSYHKYQGVDKLTSAAQLDLMIARRLRTKQLNATGKPVKSNAEKFELIAAHLGPAAATFGVEMNAEADRVCEDSRAEPAMLGPQAIGTRRVVVCQHYGIPIHGYITEHFDELYPKLVNNWSTAHSASKFLARRRGNDERTLSSFPLKNGNVLKKHEGPGWIGRSLGNAAYKLLTQSFFSGAKECKINNDSALIPLNGRLGISIKAPAELSGSAFTRLILDKLRALAGLTPNPLAPRVHIPRGTRNRRVYIGLDNSGLSCDTTRYRSLNPEHLRNALVACAGDPVCKADFVISKKFMQTSRLSTSNPEAAHLQKAITFAQRRIVVCPFCAVHLPAGFPIALANTRHILWTCPFAGQDVLRLIQRLFDLFEAFGVPGTPANDMIPWFTSDAAYDYAHNTDRYQTWISANNSLDFPPRHNTLSTRVVCNAREETIFTTQADAPLELWGRQFFGNRLNGGRVLASGLSETWALEDGDRGAIPESSNIFDKSLADDFNFWMIARTEILAFVNNRWRKYGIARAAVNRALNAELLDELSKSEPRQATITDLWNRQRIGTALNPLHRPPDIVLVDPRPALPRIVPPAQLGLVIAADAESDEEGAQPVRLSRPWREPFVLLDSPSPPPSPGPDLDDILNIEFFRQPKDYSPRPTPD